MRLAVLRDSLRSAATLYPIPWHDISNNDRWVSEGKTRLLDMSCLQAGVQVLFLVGNDAWASSDDTKNILQLLGCPKALSTIDILWVKLMPLVASPAMCPDAVNSCVLIPKSILIPSALNLTTLLSA